MKHLRFFVFVPLVIASALGQTASHGRATGAPDSPEALVRSLYRRVVACPPYGDLEGRELKTFAPYLSKSLLQRFEFAHACSKDWFRQHPANDEKAPFGRSESGPFSGANERTGPMAFNIGRSEIENDGTHHVYVKLKWWETSYDAADAIHHATVDRPVIWEVAPVVTRENGRFVLDDVIYLKDKDMDKEYRLSEVLAKGCDGGRWVGYREQH